MIPDDRHSAGLADESGWDSKIFVLFFILFEFFIGFRQCDVCTYTHMYGVEFGTQASKTLSWLHGTGSPRAATIQITIQIICLIGYFAKINLAVGGMRHLSFIYQLLAMADPHLARWVPAHRVARQHFISTPRHDSLHK